MQQHNPYLDASNAYSNNKAASLSDPRTMEAQALMKAAAKLDVVRKALTDGQNVSVNAIGEPLEYNKKLWIVFADSMADASHDLPQQLKNNIASLAVFMLKKTIDVMADPQPDKLATMIDINRQIASGLMKTPPREQTATAPASGATDAIENKREIVDA